MASYWMKFTFTLFVLHNKPYKPMLRLTSILKIINMLTTNGNLYRLNLWKNQLNALISQIHFWHKTLHALGFCDRASWVNCEVWEETNKMQQLDVYYQHFLNMFRASLCPSSGDQDVCYCTWCVALVLLDVATNHIQQNQRSTPRAVTHVLVSWRWA